MMLGISKNTFTKEDSANQTDYNPKRFNQTRRIRIH